MDTTVPSQSAQQDDYDYDYATAACEASSGLLPASSYQPALLMLVFCLGLAGNVTVLWILLRHIRLKTMTDICLLNLTLSDLVLVLTLPLWGFYTRPLPGVGGDGPCKLMSGAYQLGLYSGTLFVTLMSVDRYLAIVHAVAAWRTRTLRYGTGASIVVWALSLTASLPHAIFSVFTEDGCQPDYPEDTVLFWKMYQNFSENTLSLFICLPVMLFCYISILAVLQKSRNFKKDRAMKLIFTIVSLFVICWVPYNVVVFLLTLQMFDIGNNCVISARVDSALGVTQTLALTHCCINPVIYAFVGEKFRKSLTQALSKYPFSKYLGIHAASRIRGSENETTNTPVQ